MKHEQPRPLPVPVSRCTWFLATLTALAVAGCNPGDADRSATPNSDNQPSASAGPSAYPFQAVATVGMIADIVKNVAGEHANVRGIIGEGVDPHLYKPTSSDVKMLQAADIVFYNGLMLEGKMGDVLVRVARKGKPVHAVTEAILDQGDYVLTDQQEHYDPHVWMDVQGWIRAVEVVSNALAEFDRNHGDAYRRNAEQYTISLRALDAYCRRVTASIPEQQRVLVTAHDAFNYMARAYGLEVRGI